MSDGIRSKNQKMVTKAFVQMRRESLRKDLSPLYLPFFDRLCSELEFTYWAPYSGRRTLEKQLELYNKGRTLESRALGEAIVTRARPGDSPHNWGCATDWAEFRPEFVGQEIWNKANWYEFGAAVEKMELTWGGRFKFVDKPHAELKIRCSWGQIGKIFREQGKLKADEAILAAFMDMGFQTEGDI